jgi:hypothetical protein
MKKILFAISLIFVLTSCDDGDVEVQNITFEDVTMLKCDLNNLLYKINGSEALLFDIARVDINTNTVFTTAFANEETLENAPRTVEINATNKVIYRAFNGTVAPTRLCATIVDATPAVTEEWTAISGTAEIITTPVKTTSPTTGIEKITGYNQYIVFKNITFQKPNGTQTYETFVFGNYFTPEVNLPFAFEEPDLAKSTCAGDNRLFNIKGGEVLELNLDNATFASVIQSSVTTTPRTAVLNTTNTLKYKLFSSTITNDYFCTTVPPATPTLTQEWIAADGLANVSGIVEVTTTTFGTQFQHTVHLRNVTFVRGNSNFKLGNDYILGTFYTD